MDPVAPSQGQCQARAALQPVTSLFAPFSRRGISGAASRTQEVFLLLVGCDALGAGHSPGSESGAAVMWPVSHIFPETHRIREVQG